MDLPIFVDLTYNPFKNFKSYSLPGQNFKIFLNFTYNQGKVFLILPITQGGGAHVYMVSIGSPPLPDCKNVHHHVIQKFYVKLEELFLCDICISLLCKHTVF